MSKFTNFLSGALLGAGVGILLAPKEGSKTREDLKKSWNELKDTIKNMDFEEAKETLKEKVESIQQNFSDLTPDQSVESIEEKKEIIAETCDEIIKVSQENEIPMVEKTAKKVKEQTEMLAKDIIEEVKEQPEKKTTSPKKKNMTKKSTTKKTTPKKKTQATKKKTVKKTK